MQSGIPHDPPFCWRSGTVSGPSADLADQGMERGIPMDHQEASNTQYVDLEASSSQECGRKGFIGLSTHRRDDVMYLLTRRFRQQAAYCLDTKASCIEKIWREIVRSTDRGDNGTVEKVTNDLFKEVKAYFQFASLNYQMEGLAKPNRQLLKHFVEVAKLELGEEHSGFLGAPHEDWAENYPIETLDRWLKVSLEYGAIRPFWKLFLRKTTTHEHFETHEYPDGAFRVVVITIFHIVIVSLVGVPVVVQALDLLPMLGNVVMYMLCLVCFIILTQTMVRSESTQFLMSLAYAAVMVSNLSRGR
ncbi:hypothetical protein EDB81DRAFT_878351 [Dactylonectria macrodidyma]|uniref:DUF6594 domain-containing protein n=1 Tax=Dactylonectria macrodidyma TaxID=307937 RepID=A0A9P9JK00_9HYPO|nr:hypothetical protein EDB81DRAFT_878351 [Dactylonectria macrodidyma]